MDKDYWDSVADLFDEEVLKILDRDRSGVLKASIAEVASLRKSVADFGCGNGSLLPVLAPLFHHVHAIDHSSNLLADARRRNTAADNIRYEQADLSLPFRIARKVDALLCINVLIQPDAEVRECIFENVVASLKHRGTLILVVPAYESLLHTYQTIVEINIALGIRRKQAVSEIEAVFREEVLSPIRGTVMLGTEPTKLHTREEITTLLSDHGMKSMVTRRIEYDWSEMIDNAPAGLGEPYPWDWLVIARKP